MFCEKIFQPEGVRKAVKSIWLFVVCILCACSAQKGADLPEGDRLGNQAIIDFARKMEGDGLSLIGIGGGEKDGKTWKLIAKFRAGTELTVEKARELIIKSANSFLKTINEDEVLRPYLFTYPYCLDNIEISILRKSVEYPTDGLFFVNISQSRIMYDKDNPNGGLSITVLEETYEEALKKLEEQNKKSNHNVLSTNVSH